MISATVQGLQEVQTLLATLASAASDLTPVLSGAVDRRISQYWIDAFASEGGTVDGPWAGLSAMTLKRRQRPGHGVGGIGVDTGAMRGSLVSSTGPGALQVVTPSSITRGTLVQSGGRPYPTYFAAGGGSDTVFGHPRKAAYFAQPPRALLPSSGEMPVAFVEGVEQDILAYLMAAT